MTTPQPAQSTSVIDPATGYQLKPNSDGSLNTTLDASNIALETGGNLASSKTDLDNILTAIGAISDSTWSGSGNGSQVAILKKVVALLAATLSVSGTITANAGTNLNTSLLALETGGNLASIKTDSDSIVTNTSNTATNTSNTATNTSNINTHVTNIDTATAASKTDLDSIVTNTGKIPAQGAAITSASTPVNIASDQTVPVKGGFAEQASLTAGSLNADLVASTDVSAYKWMSIHVVGTYSGTLTFQASNDNSNWINILLYRIDSANSLNASATTTLTNVIFAGQVQYRYLRIRMTSYASGTAQGTLELYTQATSFNLNTLTAVQGGTWTVQPGNTPNTTAWLAMPSGATSAIIAAGATGPTVIKASAGIFYGALITSVGAGAPLGYDNATTTSGNIISAVAASAAVGTRDTPPSVGSKFTSGLTFAGGATMPAMTVFYS